MCFFVFLRTFLSSCCCRTPHKKITAPCEEEDRCEVPNIVAVILDYTKIKGDDLFKSESERVGAREREREKKVVLW